MSGAPGESLFDLARIAAEAGRVVMRHYAAGAAARGGSPGSFVPSRAASSAATFMPSCFPFARCGGAAWIWLARSPTWPRRYPCR